MMHRRLGLVKGKMTKDKATMHHATNARARRHDETLGPNTDIGMKLRALYGAVQNEVIPDRFLDLLEKLDEAERKAAAGRE
jgi:hypothetical protein